MGWYLTVLQKYAVFQGRARRNEYWYFVLFNFLISFGIGLFEGVLGAILGTDIIFLSTIYSLVILVPSLAVAVRRLHDTGRSGWWLLIGLIPLVGWIILIFFLASESQSGENQYG